MVLMSLTLPRILHLARDAADPTDLTGARAYAVGAGTSRAIAQMNPVSSRATAVATLGFAFPRVISFRYREVSRSCAFHAMSQIGFGKASWRMSRCRLVRAGPW